MNIESELPENFDELEAEKKVEELEKLLEKLGDQEDSDILKRRMIEELIRKYRS